MISVAELAAICGADVVGPAERLVCAVAPLDLARDCEVSWIRDISLIDQLANSQAGAVAVPCGTDLPHSACAFLVCDNVIAARAQIVDALHRSRGRIGRHHERAAFVDRTARLQPSVVISPGVVIGCAVEIGADSWIGPGAVIDNAVLVGERCHIEAGSILGPGTRVGQDCRIGPAALVGMPPDAYGWDGDGLRAESACGIVVLGDRVEVGPGAQIQRGVQGATVVGADSKVGAQCGIGHDCRIGLHSILCPQTGIAAGAVVGDHAVIGSQVGVNNDVKIGDWARVGAKSGVMGNIPDHGSWWGYPALPKMRALRLLAALRRLSR